MAVSASNYSSTIIQKSADMHFSASARKVFKSGQVVLNGKSVNIGGSIEDTARKINRSFKHTGIKAKIETKGNKARLVLITSGNKVDINDPKKLLLNFYKGNKIGNSQNSLIQIIGNKNRPVTINYSTNKDVSPLVNHLKQSIEGGSNVKYIKNNILIQPYIAAEIEAIAEEKDAIIVQDPIEFATSRHSYADFNIFGNEEIDFFPSLTDLAWGVASIAYESAKETTLYGYKTVRTHLFGDA